MPRKIDVMAETMKETSTPRMVTTARRTPMPIWPPNRPGDDRRSSGASGTSRLLRV